MNGSVYPVPLPSREGVKYIIPKKKTVHAPLIGETLCTPNLNIKKLLVTQGGQAPLDPGDKKQKPSPFRNGFLKTLCIKLEN
jgi:hypothetical protein